MDKKKKYAFSYILPVLQFYLLRLITALIFFGSHFSF